MEKFREEFLIEAVSKLEQLHADLATSSSLNDFAQNNFRELHTLKGSSQAFGLDIPGKFAHQIESLFQIIRDLEITSDVQFRDILDQSIEALSELFEKSLKNIEVSFPEHLFAEIEYLTASRKKKVDSFSLPEGFPADLLNQLSVNEIKGLQLAVFNEKCIFLVDILLNFSDFDSKFRSIRKVFEDEGEILASLPNPSISSSEEIGFRVLFVTKLETISDILPASQYNSTIAYQYIPNSDVEDERRKTTLKNVLDRTIVGGEKIAKLLDKEIEFEINAENVELSDELLKILGNVMLHLVRNSIDHGLETKKERIELGKSPTGKITISTSKINEKLLLKLKDDGRGIDKEKVLQLAIERQLILPVGEISEERAWQIVFTPGFSTSQFVSEISGRGVGLDAVESIIKKIDGEIRVHSTFGHGTEFEIYIPNA
jgi:two-component system, chemotaxis family, sensor kinase CheA